VSTHVVRVQVDKLEFTKRLEDGAEVFDAERVRHAGDEQSVVRHRGVLVRVRVETLRETKTGAERGEVDLERLSGTLAGRRSREILPATWSVVDPNDRHHAMPLTKLPRRVARPFCPHGYAQPR
jgi:hypothetical protein